MSLYGAFDKTKHFEELADPIIGSGIGTITAATRRLTAVRNLTGVAALVLADFDKLAALTATADEINAALDVSARVQELLASGAVTPGIQSLELNHATVIIEATLADATLHPGLFIVKDTSASGTAAHTVTITTGTWNGTNKVATLNAPNEALVVYFDSAGNGTIVENVGAVALSG